MSEEFALDTEAPSKPAKEAVRDREVYEALLQLPALLGTERDVIERHLAGEPATSITLKRLEQIKQAHMRELIEAKVI